MQNHDVLRQVFEKAARDDAFRAALLAAPDETLRAQGFVIPAGVTCTFVEDTPGLRHLVLPAPPARLSDADLDLVAGGAGDVQLSSNVVNAIQQINDAGALQFDVPNYVQQNMPMPQVYPAYWYDGSMGGSPGVYR